MVYTVHMTDQRDRILRHACDLYLADGMEGFSMRKLARAVGVTAPALYRHYESKERVLLDVVGEAYERLGRSLYDALQGGTPEERFLLAGRGYLDFALDHPRLYEVLFTMPDLVGPETSPPEIQAQACAIGQFWNDRVRECMDAGILQAADPDAVGLTLWGHAHGLISLYLIGALPMDEVAFREAYMASGRRVLQGLGTVAYAEQLARRTAAASGGNPRDGRNGERADTGREGEDEGAQDDGSEDEGTVDSTGGVAESTTA